MNEEKFLKLLETNKGFEITLSFINDEDHFVGGSGNCIWYYVQKKSKVECWLARLKDGKWTDSYYTGKKDDFKKKKDLESGSVLSMITERLYFGQDYIEQDGRKPTETSKYDYKLDHYTYKFGEIAYDISQDYGITVSYSNINDISVGFSFRDIKTGEAVKPPVA